MRFLPGFALVMGLMSSVATADVEVGDPIGIFGESVTGPWGGTVIQGGGQQVVPDPFGLSVFVDPIPLPPPPGKRSAGIIMFDFLFTELIFEGPVAFDIMLKDPKDPDANPINFAEALDQDGDPIGVIEWTDSNIFWSESFALEIFRAEGIFSISWTQVPAPGSLALLGFAGLCGGRRQRR